MIDFLEDRNHSGQKGQTISSLHGQKVTHRKSKFGNIYDISYYLCLYLHLSQE